jgi:oligosaccharyltransferase complex subunit delta (ribophorin II)
VEKLFYLSGKYDIELTVGDAVMVSCTTSYFKVTPSLILLYGNLNKNILFQENSFSRLLGHVELDLPEAPEKAARPPLPPVDPYSRYGPKAEINHIFRVPEKRPPQKLSLVFLGLILLPFIGFLVGVSLLIKLILRQKTFRESELDY